MYLKQFFRASNLVDRRFNVFIIILLAFLTVINTLKAILIPFGFDESATFFHYVSFWRVLPFISDWDANNHYLNSLLTLIFSRLFGESNLALRLANVLAFPVYLWFVYLISLKISHLVLRICFISILYLSLGFIDFFCLSRGYGLSLGLLSIAVFYLIKAWETPAIKHDLSSLVFASLATYANLTLINTLVVVIGLLLVRPLIKPVASSCKILIIKSLTFIIAGVLPLSFMVVVLFVLKTKGALYYGLPSGYVETTIGSLLFMLTGFNSQVVNWLFIAFALCIFCFTCFILIKQGLKNWNGNTSFAILFNSLFLLNLLAPLILKILLDVNYPQDRTVLYLWFFFIGSVVFTINWAINEVHLKLNWVLLVFFPFLYFPLHFALNLNFTHTFHYSDDSLPPRFFQKIKDSHQAGDYPPLVGGYTTRLLTWAMYNYRSGGNESQISFKNYPGLEEDYQIVDPNIYPTWKTYYDSIDYDNIGKRVLYKRKQKLETIPLDTSKPINYYGNPAKEFFSLYEAGVDTLIGNRLRLDFDMSIYVHLLKTRAWIVVSTQDQQSKELIYQCFPLHWFKQRWDGSPHNFKNRMLIPELPPQSHKVKVFLWNIDKQPIIIKEGKCYLSRFPKRESWLKP